MPDKANSQQKEIDNMMISRSGAGNNSEFNRKQPIEVIIHTMPKRFLNIVDTVKNQKTKGLGLLVVVGGIILLVVILAVFYYMYTKSSNSVLVVSDDIIVEQPIEQPVEKPVIEPVVEPVKEEEDEIVPDNIVNIDIVASSAEEIINESSSTEEVVDEIIEIQPILKTAQDSDMDGLSDIEEILLDSNQRAKDSDGDGYEDFSELLKLYNPAGAGSIMINPNIEKYNNSLFNYSMYYPESWIVNDGGGEESVVFQIGGTEFIQVIIESNPEKINIEDWYKEQMNKEVILPTQKVYKAGWAGVKSEESLIYYLISPKSDNIFIITYSPGKDTLKFKNIFMMMINSLEIKN